MENKNEIWEKICSGNPVLIAEAIKEIHEKGNLTIAVELLKRLEQKPAPPIASTLVNLLADIKDQGFRDIVIENIRKAQDIQLKIDLLQIVWESSLDYTAYLDIFWDILCHDDFLVAFEASTVIENMIHHLSEEQLQRLHALIGSFPADKRFLVENIQEEMGCSEED